MSKEYTEYFTGREPPWLLCGESSRPVDSPPCPLSPAERGGV